MEQQIITAAYVAVALASLMAIVVAFMVVVCLCRLHARQADIKQRWKARHQALADWPR